MASGESKRPFEVHSSGALKQRFWQLQIQATVEARGAQLFAAYLQIFQRLRTDPLTYGEPLYPLPHMRLQVRTCSVRPLAVEYAVSVEHHMVFIKAYHLFDAPEV